MIVHIFSCMVSKKTMRVVLTASFIIVSLVFGVMPLFVKPEIQERVPHHFHQTGNIGRNRQSLPAGKQLKSTQLTDEVPDTVVYINSIVEFSHSKTGQEKKHKQRELNTIEVYGSMTLNEVAANYNIPATELASCIHVPKEYTGERLGRLRKQYGFHMNDLRNYIASKNK